MHEYYAANQRKLKRAMNKMLSHIRLELEERSGVAYPQLLEEIWLYYRENLLSRFPYVGGDKVSGTRNLTGAYCYVAMGEVLKGYGVSLEDSARLMVTSYERETLKIPWLLRQLLRKAYTSPRLLGWMLQKKDAANRANAKENPGSFETKTQFPPEEGYDFSYHNLVCPLASFARAYGYEEYMPYLCNLDYVLYGVLGAPLYREHTCFEDGDYCDFKLKLCAKPMPYWPPVFSQGKGFK